jgi:hypothetical protein
MFLCQYDGKLHDNKVKSHTIILKQMNLQNISKDIEIEVCHNCYGIVNCRHFAELGNVFLVQPKDKIKIYKITSSIFENKDLKDKNDQAEKNILDILSVMKKSIRKNSKKS